MISEGSCDTEDWSNGENSALITGMNYIFKHITIEHILNHSLVLFSPSPLTEALKFSHLHLPSSFAQMA